MNKYVFFIFLIQVGSFQGKEAISRQMATLAVSEIVLLCYIKGEKQYVTKVEYPNSQYTHKGVGKK